MPSLEKEKPEQVSKEEKTEGGGSSGGAGDRPERKMPGGIRPVPERRGNR